VEISFTKLSDIEHKVRVTRSDGSVDEAVLNSRSFLRHDLAHLAVELEVPLRQGFWGSVASGAQLEGSGFGADIGMAESLAAPIQILMRTEAPVSRYLAVIGHLIPELASEDLAKRIHERARQLQGHWRATPYGESMEFTWQE